MPPLTTFDACCYLGRHVRMPQDQPETAEELLAAMDHFGIHEALVVDTLAREANPRAGNERLLQRTADHPRLHPAWAGLMPHSRELPPPREFVDQMRERGVLALFLFYGQFDIRLDAWGVDALLEPLAEAGVPVFLCPNNWQKGLAVDATDWRGVVRVCQAFPQLPVIVTENRIYKSQRAVYAALEACENLKIDLSALWLHDRIEFVCRHFGPDRLVWGSQLPERNPGVPLMQMGYSDVPEDDLALIAGGTLRKLFAWNPHFQSAAPEVELPPAIDALHAAARNREPLAGERFYDCHGHIGWASPHHVVHDGLEEIVAEMDRFGVRACCVFGLEGVFADETYTNDEVAAAVQRYPDRFLGFALANPNHGESLMRAELARCEAMGLRGIKLICSYHGYPTEGPLIDVACQYAHDRGWLILNHNWGSAAQIERLCTTCPDACFITGHSASGYERVTRAVDNLYICTCPMLQWGQMEAYVARYGSDRLLFGSDLTDLPIAWGLAPILYAKIPESDKRKILGGNTARLMKQYGGSRR